MDLNIPLPVIGIVHTSHAELETTPIQAGLNRAEHGTIEIADRGVITPGTQPLPAGSGGSPGELSG